MTISRRTFTMAALAGVAATGVVRTAQAQPAVNTAYFTESPNMVGADYGPHLAVSRDGLNWTPFNQNDNSGKALDVYNFSTSDGGHIRLVNRNSGKAVEVQGSSTADGANIVQYTDHGGANQQWQLVRVG